jgi:hypothetical protein
MKWIVFMTMAASAYAQFGVDPVRKATISGSRGTSGRCVVEVRVDGIAEVDIFGDSGRLRNLAGQPATWTRMECTDPLPYQMSDFRFRGIDGRGNVRLVQDPRNNNSMAVVRIEDPKGGAEGYTFQIEWSGASGGAPTGFNDRDTRRPTGAFGGRFPGRGAESRLSAEQSIDMCRTEVRSRAERDYGLRNIDITAAAVDNSRRDWVNGTFTERGSSRRGSGYRFNCEIDSRSGQVRNVEFQRADGSPLQPGNTGTIGGVGGGDTAALRACQDAVVARVNRNGYENVRFTSTQVDRSRVEWVSGALTASRSSVTDNFDFGCSMDMRNATVRNVEVNRR